MTRFIKDKIQKIKKFLSFISFCSVQRSVTNIDLQHLQDALNKRTDDTKLDFQTLVRPPVEFSL